MDIPYSKLPAERRTKRNSVPPGTRMHGRHENLQAISPLDPNRLTGPMLASQGDGPEWGGLPMLTEEAAALVRTRHAPRTRHAREGTRCEPHAAMGYSG